MVAVDRRVYCKRPMPRLMRRSLVSKLAKCARQPSEVAFNRHVWARVEGLALVQSEFTRPQSTGWWTSSVRWVDRQEHW